MTLVRGASPADVAAVVRLEQECLGRDAWSEGLVREGVHSRLPTVGYLVAVVDEEVVGHAVTSLAGDVVELQRIAVLAAYRRTGVAGALLDAALTAASYAEAERMLLEVREDNHPALAFYAAHGFVEISRRTRYYADGATAVVMQREVTRGTRGGRGG